MRISEERKQLLYEAISEPIMKSRIENKRATVEPTTEEIDRVLYYLEQRIWARVATVLNIDA